MKNQPNLVSYGLCLLTATAALIGAGGLLQAQDKKPNILIIWGDDIGWFNISANNHGIMGYRTPNIDRIAKEGGLVHRLVRPAKLHRGPGLRSSPGSRRSAPG